MITINMGKARDIKRDRIRDERKPLLEQLDVMFMRAIEANDQEKVATIASIKNALRDAPADEVIEITSTPEALKVLMLPCLEEAQDFINQHI